MALNIGQSNGKTPDRGHGLYVTALVMVIVAGFFVIGRLAARWMKRKFGMDDYTIVLSLLCSMGLTVTIDLAVVHGYGKHKKDLTHEELMAALKWFYFAQILYKMVLGFNKVSMLCLYLGIFIGRIFRWLCYATLVVVVGWSVGSVLVTIFQCVPISAFWNKSIEGSHCIDSDAFWYAYGIINILTDAAIFVLPLREVVQLQLPRREKVGLLIVFLLGAFVCITSIVRVIAVANSTKNKMDTTWSFIPRSTWTLIEANTGIICACLPMLKQPLTILFPHLSRGTTNRSAARPSHNSYHLNSHPTAKTWVSSEGTIMSSVTAGQQTIGPHARDSEEEQIIGSQHRNQPRGIMRKTDVVVSHHCCNAESTTSFKNATSMKEQI